MEKELKVSIPELVLLAATRGVIGLGAGLLLANKISPKKRKKIGLPLFAAGVLSTVPIAWRLFHDDENNDAAKEKGH